MVDDSEDGGDNYDSMSEKPAAAADARTPLQEREGVSDARRHLATIRKEKAEAKNELYSGEESLAVAIAGEVAKQVSQQVMAGLNERRKNDQQHVEEMYRSEEEAALRNLDAETEWKRADAELKRASARKILSEQLADTQQSPLGALAAQFNEQNYHSPSAPNTKPKSKPKIKYYKPPTPEPKSDASESKLDTNDEEDVARAPLRRRSLVGRVMDTITGGEEVAYVQWNQAIVEHFVEQSDEYFVQNFTVENIDEMDDKSIRTALGVAHEKNLLRVIDADILKYANEKAWSEKTSHNKNPSPVRKQIKSRLRADYKAFTAEQKKKAGKRA